MNHNLSSNHSAADAREFLVVLNEHKGIIYKIANAYCQHAEDRKDLVQEINIQLWRSFKKYDPQYKRSTFIYRIAFNTAISFYRKEHRRKDLSHALSDDTLSPIDSGYNNQADEQLLLLHQSIAGLKDLDKALLLLYLDEKSLKEIAGIMEMSETNVSTKINRIKKILQQKFLHLQKQV